MHADKTVFIHKLKFMITWFGSPWQESEKLKPRINTETPTRQKNYQYIPSGNPDPGIGGIKPTDESGTNWFAHFGNTAFSKFIFTYPFCPK